MVKMLDLSKEQAINEHRRMWNWIAEETIKRNEALTKEDYMHEVFKKEHPNTTFPDFYCFCCEYIKQQNESCSKCPIKWPNGKRCDDEDSPYSDRIELNTMYILHRNSTDHEYVLNELSDLAKEIANLPERKD